MYDHLNVFIAIFLSYTASIIAIPIALAQYSVPAVSEVGVELGGTCTFKANWAREKACPDGACIGSNKFRLKIWDTNKHLIPMPDAQSYDGEKWSDKPFVFKATDMPKSWSILPKDLPSALPQVEMKYGDSTFTTAAPLDCPGENQKNKAGMETGCYARNGGATGHKQEFGDFTITGSFSC